MTTELAKASEETDQVEDAIRFWDRRRDTGYGRPKLYWDVSDIPIYKYDRNVPAEND